MYANKGLAVLLLALTVTLAHKTGWPRSKQLRTYRSNMDPRQLIQHVMRNELQWVNVLKERVKGLGDPPHGGRLNDENDKAPSIEPPPKPKPVEQGDDEKKEIADIAGTIASYSVRDIVTTVARHFMGVRSFVEYGVKALRLGISCYAMRQLIMKFDTISLMMIKEKTALDVVAAVIELKKNAAAYIDVLAFWPHDDITVMYNVYWEAVDVIQDKKIESLDQSNYPIEMITKLQKFSKNIEKLVDEQCDCILLSQDEVLRDMGIEQVPPLLTDPYLDILVQYNDLKRMSLKQTKYTDWYVKKLKIHTMPNRTWSSLFLIKGSLEETRSDLSEINVKIEFELSAISPTTGQTSSGNPVESATKTSPEGSGSIDTP